MKKKTLYWGGIAALALLLLGTFSFLRTFTQADSAAVWLDWQSAAIRSSDGTERPLELRPFYETPPELGVEEWYVFRTVLDGVSPEEDLLLELSGVEMILTLDGTPLLVSQSALPDGMPRPAQVRIPLPPDAAGKTVELRCRPLDGQTMGIFPPLLRASSIIREDAESAAYAALYAMPAAALAVVFLLLCFLFFTELLTGAPDRTLPVLALAAAVIALYRLSVGLGYHFLPPAAFRALTWKGLAYLGPALLLAYLALNRKRAFWRQLGRCTLVAAVTLGAAWVISLARDGYLAGYLPSLADELRHGYFNGLLYWLTVYLTAACTLIAAWSAIESAARQQAETSALSLKAELAVRNLRALEAHDLQTAALRHELNHHVLALDTLCRAGKMQELEAYLAELRRQVAAIPQARFTDNITVNAILQDAAARANQLGVTFQARANLPEQLPIPDGDLCSLLMNALDNALEAAAKVPEGGERFVRVHCQLKCGHLGIKCENSYTGPLDADPESGTFRSTKEDPALHGFGIKQMQAVAKKYQSLLDISHTDEVFTVQAALKLPEA